MLKQVIHIFIAIEENKRECHILTILTWSGILSI